MGACGDDHTSERVVDLRAGTCAHGPVEALGPNAEPGLCESTSQLAACQQGSVRRFAYTREAYATLRRMCRPENFTDYCHAVAEEVNPDCHEPNSP